MRTLRPDVVVVGGGPSGLTAATALAPHVGEVLVLDREQQAGGTPRHSDHPGYGVRDLRRMMTGPAHAARLVEQAQRAGVSIRTQAMVTHLDAGGVLSVTSPAGLLAIRPRALILATGARERARPARLVAGTRPAGVLTTGQLQTLVHLQHRSPGRRAVIVGAELVSWSAALTLREAGCRTILMTSRYDRPETYRPLSALAGAGLRIPVSARTRLVEIEGRSRVESVVLQRVDTGQKRRVRCDTVVLTGDWIPENELARACGLDIATGSLSPVVDGGLRTSTPGVFAIGNLVHPVDTADVAALDGRRVVSSVLPWLSSGSFPTQGVALRADGALRWISPCRLTAGDSPPSRCRLLAWVDRPVRLPVVEVRQGGHVLGRRRIAWPASPGRVFRIPSSVLQDVDRSGDEVSVRVG